MHYRLYGSLTMELYRLFVVLLAAQEPPTHAFVEAPIVDISFDCSF
jgi:hypothetical protein